MDKKNFYVNANDSIVKANYYKWMSLPKNQDDSGKKTLYNKLSDFSFPKKFEDIDEDWHLCFTIWLNQQEYTKNYIAKFTKDLLTFMNYTHKKKIHNSELYKDIKKDRTN